MGPKPSPERLREHEGGSSQTGLGGAARHPRARGARHPSWHMLMTACAKGGGGYHRARALILIDSIVGAGIWS